MQTFLLVEKVMVVTGFGIIPFQINIDYLLASDIDERDC